MIHLFFVWGASHTLFPWQQRLSGPVPTAPNRISLLSKCVKWFVCLHVAIISTAEEVHVCACMGRWKEEGFHACNGLTEARWLTHHHSAGLHTSHQPKDSYTRHVELALHTAYTRPIKNKPKMHAVTWPTDAAGTLFMDNITAHTQAISSFRKNTSYKCTFLLTEEFPTCQN